MVGKSLICTQTLKQHPVTWATTSFRFQLIVSEVIHLYTPMRVALVTLDTVTSLTLKVPPTTTTEKRSKNHPTPTTAASNACFQGKDHLFITCCLVGIDSVTHWIDFIYSPKTLWSPDSMRMMSKCRLNQDYTYISLTKTSNKPNLTSWYVCNVTCFLSYAIPQIIYS